MVSTSLHPPKEEEKNSCREKILTRRKGFSIPFVFWIFLNESLNAF
jgi:hypothetical protein